MSDLLSAASLFLAVIGLLYSAWYSEIIKAIALTAPIHKDDQGPIIRKKKAAYQSRALPLAIASVTLAAVLTPDLISVTIFALRTVYQKGFAAVILFNPVKTLFCAIAVTSIGLAVHTSRLALRTRACWKKLIRRPKKPQKIISQGQ